MTEENITLTETDRLNLSGIQFLSPVALETKGEKRDEEKYGRGGGVCKV